MKRRSFVAASTAALLVPGPLQAQQKDADKVVVAQAFQSLLYLPLYVGIDRGFFAKHDVAVTKVTAGSGANGVASVISGSATFSLQDPMTAVLANLKGAKIKSIGAVVNGLPVWIVVRKDSPIKKLADLAGKRVATAIPPSTSTYLLQNLLTKRSITANVDTVLLGTELAPLLAGKADAAALYEPYLEAAIAQNCRILYEFSRVVPGGYAFSSIDALEETLKSRPQMVERFLAGLDDAIRFIAANPDGAVEVAVAEFPSLPADQIRSGVRRMLREGVYPRSALIEESSFVNALALQVQVGNIKAGTVQYADAVDSSFAAKVVRR